MKNEIVLEFDKVISGLAGYDYGKEVFELQVKDKIDYNDKIIIVFPETIQRVASSFVQGFFEEIVEKVGIYGVENNIEIRSSKPDMKQIIVNNLV